MAERDSIFAQLDLLISSGHGDTPRYIEPPRVKPVRKLQRHPYGMVRVALLASGMQITARSVTRRMKDGRTLDQAIHSPKRGKR